MIFQVIFYANINPITIPAPITQASNITGFSISGIAMCCRKEYHTYMGYVWRLEGDSFSLTKKQAKIVKKYDKNNNLILLIFHIAISDCIIFYF